MHVIRYHIRPRSTPGEMFLAITSGGSRARPARAYHHGDLREALIAVTLRQIEETGPEGISVAALSKEVGVSQPAYHRHFAGKDALLAAVAARGFGLFGQALQEAVAGLPPGDRLAANAKAYVAFGNEHPGLYQLMFGSRVLAEAPQDSDLAVAARASFDLLLDALRATRPDAEVVRDAVGLWAGLHGLVQLGCFRFLSGPRTRDVPVDGVIDDMVSSKILKRQAITSDTGDP